LETVVDGIPIPWEWPVAGRLHVSHREKRNFIPRKTAKTEVKMFPQSIRGQGGLLDIVLHPDYAKMVDLHHHASTEGEEKAETLNS
jgi:glucose/arabinose dehydrogenase